MGSSIPEKMSKRLRELFSPLPPPLLLLRFFCLRLLPPFLFLLFLICRFFFAFVSWTMICAGEVVFGFRDSLTCR